MEHGGLRLFFATGDWKLLGNRLTDRPTASAISCRPYTAAPSYSQEIAVRQAPIPVWGPIRGDVERRAAGREQSARGRASQGAQEAAINAGNGDQRALTGAHFIRNL
jgi:hypothetical protein